VAAYACAIGASRVRSYCEWKRSIFDEEDAGPEQIDLRAGYFHTRRWGFRAALFCRDRRMKLALSPRGMGANLAPAKARNVVLVHGLLAGGSCWSEVIARLAEGKNNRDSRKR